MKKFAAVVLCSLTIISCSGGKSVSLSFEETSFTISDADNFNGVILIGNRDSIITVFSNGYANLEYDVAISERTIFNIASLTKQFTAAAILLLEEQDSLSVNDTVDKYLHDYRFADRITIHQLMTHSAGVPNYNLFDDYDSVSVQNNERKELIDWINKHELSFKPGTGFEYSNSGYFLLAAIIEEASGKPYRKFLKENIFLPSGMIETDNYTTSDIIKSRAERYGVDWGDTVKADWFDFSFKLGSASIFSSAVDLYKWYHALFNGKILSEKSFKKMFTRHMNGYCYGVGAGDSEREFYEHDGDIPGIDGYTAYFVNPDYVLIMLSNFESHEFWDLRDNLREFFINYKAGELK